MVHRIVKLEKEYSIRYSLLYKYYKYKGDEGLILLTKHCTSAEFWDKKDFFLSCKYSPQKVVTSTEQYFLCVF